MTFKEAKEELKELAENKYHSLSYEHTQYADGEIKIMCRIYIKDKTWFEGTTWEEAFEAMERGFNGAYSDEGQPE